MYGFKEYSSCGALYNREHCCSNVSSVDNFVRDPNPISYDETSDSSQQTPRNCSKCGGPFGGLYCQKYTYERCRRNYTDEVYALCCYEVETSFVNDSNPNSFIDSPNIFNPPPQPQTYSCELCGNDAHFGYDFLTQVPFISNPDPCYNQNFDDNFPQTSPSLPQYLCCTSCGGPHETFHMSFQCQPMNQNYFEPNPIYNSNSSSFDQFPQYPVSSQPPEESIKEFFVKHAQEMITTVQSAVKIFPIFDDDDDEYTIQYKKYLENSSNAFTPDLPTKEPDNSLICNDFTTFSNPLFDYDDDFFSSDDESFSDEDVPKENFKIYSNPLFDEEIISSKIDPHHFNAESDLIESLLNQDISTVSYPKIDYLLEEFFGKLTHINLIPPRINKADFDPEEEIRLIEELLYDNSFPRPPEESNSKIFEATIESSSPSPIPVEDSDSLMEEIDLFLDPDDSIPPGIESDDYESEGDILFLEELLSNDSLSLPETESLHFDHYDVPSSPRPPAKPPDDGIFFDFEPDTGVLTAKVVEDISEYYVLMPKLLLTQPILCPYIDTLHPFSSENEDKVFNLGILSSPLLSHRGKITFDFSKSLMMIYGEGIPILDVPYLHFYPP
ncbi:hypothetical protein Tco_0530045 [Tanacetum coccineum]